MGKKYVQWRELSIDPFQINFSKIVIKKIISFPPAENDVVECKCIFNNQIINVFIKIERSKMANFLEEEKNLELLYNNYYNKVPKLLEFCEFNGKKIIALEKITGDRLSDIISNGITVDEKQKYLFNYGNELAVIHSIPVEKFNNAKQRIINDYPKTNDYITIDNFIRPYIDYLKENKPEINNNCFIHGDFHYANVLWENKKINGVLDFEYSGRGFKEQDIAWSLILRPSQTFMDNIADIKIFLDGYKAKGSYDKNKLKWCLINGYCHFYLMNIKNAVYIEKIKELILSVINEKNY